MNIKELWNSIFSNKNTYRIISKTVNKHTYYLIQRRRQTVWEYVKDQILVGYDKTPIDYPAYFETIESAEARVKSEMNKDANLEVVTRVEKVFEAEVNSSSVSTR